MEKAFAKELGLKYGPEDDESENDDFVIDVDIKHHFLDNRAERQRKVETKKEIEEYELPATLYEFLNPDKRCRMF